MVTDSLLIEGHYRSFSYQQPVVSLLQGSVVLVLHGSGGTGKGIAEKAQQLQAIAEKENLLLVYPNGYQHYWNECRKYATAAANKENINEAAFFTALIQYCHQHFGIDTNRIYAAGFSGGGHMAYKLGLTMPHKIRAIAAVAANLPDSASCDCVTTGKPLPVLIINGTADKVNPYNGGEMFVNGSSYGVVMSTQGNFQYWAALAGYGNRLRSRQLPDTDTTDGCTITEFSYRKRGRPPVVLLRVNGGGHGFPQDIDALLFVWAFFKKAGQRR